MVWNIWVVLLSMYTIIVLDCDNGYTGWYLHRITKSSLVTRVKGQAGTECFGILRDTVIHNGHIEREFMHTTTKCFRFSYLSIENWRLVCYLDASGLLEKLLGAVALVLWVCAFWLQDAINNMHSSHEWFWTCHLNRRSMPTSILTSKLLWTLIDYIR